MEQTQIFPSTISENLALDVISKLNFIGMIKSGEKVDIKSLTIISADSLTSRLYRTAMGLTFHGEGRDNLYEFLLELMHKAEELSKVYLSQKREYYTILGNKIITALMTSISGLNNLILTYEDDRLFVSKLQTLIEMVKTKSNDINKRYSQQ